MSAAGSGRLPRRRAAREPYGCRVRSDELPLSRALADRAAERRGDPQALAAARDDSSTRVVLVADGLVLGADGGLALIPADEAARWASDDASWLLLGEHDGTTYLAVRVPTDRTPPARGAAADLLVHRSGGQSAHGPDDFVALRQVGADLPALEAGLATTAVALDAWHARHPRCPRCGAATDVVQAGWVRRCVVDGSEHYPRTDPAVIMAIVDDDDRLLLGRAAAWAENRWSTLAGFVEPGESLENAVRREVAEEVGVVVGDVEYLGSQPWPFPASLMVGFVGRATTTSLHPDGVELVDARWFTRDELTAAVGAGDVIPPGRSSIARALVETWFGGPLPA